MELLFLGALFIVPLIFVLVKNQPQPGGQSPSSSEPKAYKPPSSLEEWKKDLSLVKEGRNETIEFTYETYNGDRSRRKIDLKAILTNNNDRLYFFGFCHERQENRTFNTDNITTMIKLRSKRFEVWDFLEEQYGLEW